MARPARIDLRLFQQELATRLASKTTAQVESSRLGLSCAGERWLIRLADAAEVVAVPPLAGVPLTQRWFLASRTFAATLQRRRPRRIPGARERSCRTARADKAGSSCSAQGRRHERRRGRAERARPAQRRRSHADSVDAGFPEWFGQRWADPDGGAWQEFDLAKLAADETFLRVSL
jgi:hypothetical protein